MWYTKRVWARGVLEGNGKEKILILFFFQAARKMPGNARKKENLGGVSRGKEKMLIMQGSSGGESSLLRTWKLCPR